MDDVANRIKAVLNTETFMTRADIMAALTKNGVPLSAIQLSSPLWQLEKDGVVEALPMHQNSKVPMKYRLKVVK